MADATSLRVPVNVSNDYYDNGGYDNYGSDMQSAYIPKLFANKVLAQFYNESVALRLMNQDYEGQIKSQGDSVVIRKDPIFNITDYQIGDVLTFPVPKADALTMYVDQGKSFSYEINSIDELQSDIGIVSRFQNAAMRQMKEEVDSNLMSYLTAGVSSGATSISGTLCASTNYGATAGAVSGDINLGSTGAYLALTSDAIHGYIVNLGVVLDEAKIDRQNRWAAMNSVVCGYLKTSDLKRADVTGDNTGGIRTGFQGQVDGCDIYVTNHAVNFLDGADRIYTITAGTPEYCTFASQMTSASVVQNPTGYGTLYKSLTVFARKVVQNTAAAIVQCKK